LSITRSRGVLTHVEFDLHIWRCEHVDIQNRIRKCVL